jgi:hypothetical protein
LKNRKSPGEDGIINEMIKYGGPTLWKEITVLIKQIFKSFKITEEWKTNIVIPIFKKGERINPENDRGINLLNTHLKLTTAVIAEKLVKIVHLEDEQQGFRRGRSCTDAIFVVRLLAEKAMEFNRPAFFCCIDIEKAFDKIRLKHVLSILENQSTPTGIINIIRDVYTNNYAMIKIESKLEGKIPVNQGIQQGDSLSPLLFSIVMKETIKDLKGRQGDKKVNIVCYAYAATLVADHEDDLQRLLYRFTQSCAKYDLKVSYKKTKSLTISREPLRCKLQINNAIIE